MRCPILPATSWAPWPDASAAWAKPCSELNLALLQLVEARPALARALVARHEQEHEQHWRKQEAPGRPERVVAPLRAGNDAGDDGRGDGDDAPDGYDCRHVMSRCGGARLH